MRTGCCACLPSPGARVRRSVGRQCWGGLGGRWWLRRKGCRGGYLGRQACEILQEGRSLDPLGLLSSSRSLEGRVADLQQSGSRGCCRMANAEARVPVLTMAPCVSLRQCRMEALKTLWVCVSPPQDQRTDRARPALLAWASSCC